MRVLFYKHNMDVVGELLHVQKLIIKNGITTSISKSGERHTQFSSYVILDSVMVQCNSATGIIEIMGADV